MRLCLFENLIRLCFSNMQMHVNEMFCANCEEDVSNLAKVMHKPAGSGYINSLTSNASNKCFSLRAFFQDGLNLFDIQNERSCLVIYFLGNNWRVLGLVRCIIHESDHK